MKRAVIGTFGARLLAILFSTLTSIVVARVLGPAGRGDYFLAVSLVGLALQLGALGLHSSNVYLVSADRTRLAPLAANSLVVSLVIGVLAFVLLLLLAPLWFPSLDRFTIVLAALTVGPALYGLLVSNLLLGVNRLHQFNAAELLARLLPLLFIGLVALAGSLSVQSAVLANGVATVLVALLLLWMSPVRWPIRGDWSLLRAGVGYGARAYCAALLGFMLSRIGGLMLANQGTAEQLGQLSIAMQLADLMVMLPATIGVLLFPRLVGDQQGRDRLTLRTLKVVAVMMLVACILALVLAPVLVPLVFGAAFDESVRLFRLMLPGVLALSLISVISQYLAAQGIPWSLVASWVVGLGSMVVLAWWYQPRFGAEAIAASTSCAYMLVLALLGALFRRELRHRATS
jgi:O-antigen/teichoic acid export membrane protein